MAVALAGCAPTPTATDVAVALTGDLSHGAFRYAHIADRTSAQTEYATLLGDLLDRPHLALLVDVVPDASDPDRASATIGWVVDVVPGEDPFTYTTTAPLVRVDGEWWVDWTLDVAFEGAAAGEQFRLLDGAGGLTVVLDDPSTDVVDGDVVWRLPEDGPKRP